MLQREAAIESPFLKTHAPQKGECHVGATAGGDARESELRLPRARPQMKPVLVRFDESMRIAFETERSEDNKMVAVFLPGSPDPWAGKVVLLDVDRVEPLNAEFGVAAATCEQLGRGSAMLLAESRSKSSPDSSH